MDASQPPVARAASLYLPLLTTAGFVVIVDQVTKSLALDGLAEGPVDLIDGVLTLRLTFNTGGAFGILQSVPAFFLIASGAVVVMILFWVRRIEDRSWIVPLGLVLGGGIGNLIDRVMRDTPGVVDFVDLHVWPVFNVADSAITIGVIMMLWLSLRSTGPAQSDAHERPGDPSSETR
jgi:signal peptidase II